MGFLTPTEHVILQFAHIDHMFLTSNSSNMVSTMTGASHTMSETPPSKGKSKAKFKYVESPEGYSPSKCLLANFIGINEDSDDDTEDDIDSNCPPTKRLKTSEEVNKDSDFGVDGADNSGSGGDNGSGSGSSGGENGGGSSSGGENGGGSSSGSENGGGSGSGSSSSSSSSEKWQL